MSYVPSVPLHAPADTGLDNEPPSSSFLFPADNEAEDVNYVPEEEDSSADELERLV